MFPHFRGVGMFDSLMPLTPMRRSACRGGTRRRFARVVSRHVGDPRIFTDGPAVSS
jgi:hypothetical protein